MYKIADLQAAVEALNQAIDCADQTEEHLRHAGSIALYKPLADLIPLNHKLKQLANRIQIGIYYLERKNTCHSHPKV